MLTDGSLCLAILADPASIHTRRWLSAFASRGHRVHLLVPEGVAPGDLPPGVVVARYADYGRRMRPAGGFRAARSLRRELGRVRPDVVHAHYVSRFGWLGWLAGRHPLVVSAWGSDVLRPPAGGLSRWLTGRTLAAADLVTVVSDDLGAAAVRAGARRGRIRVVQFGVDGDRFRPGPADDRLRDRLGLTGRRVVLSPRWIRPLYRQDVVVEALGRLPEDVVVVMTAESAEPASLAAVRASAERLGVGERLRILEQIPHAAMPDHYRLADVVVSVPETDAFPVTALEAMACGRPLALTDLASAREGLAELPAVGRAATRLVPVGDAVSTATAIEELLATPAGTLESAAPALREAALQRGDVVPSMDRMEGFYRALAAGREPGP